MSIMTQYRNKSTKRNWRDRDIQTLYLVGIYKNGWDTFTEYSEIDKDNEDFKAIFETLYNLYGYRYTQRNTISEVTNTLQFLIEQEGNKLIKANSVFDKNIDRLWGDYNELNQFRIGNLTEDIENFDKFKSARQTEQKSDGILDKIKKLQSMKTPMESAVKNIILVFFLPYSKPLLEKTGGQSGF